MEQFSETQLIAFALVGGVAFWLLLPVLKQLSDKQNYPYVARDFLFTKAENSFRGVLEKVVGGRAGVYGKVRIADVVTIRKGLNNSKRMSALGKIAQKHFDYVICDLKSSEILCVVELDDSSHNAKDRKKRDEFVKEVCRVAGVALVNVPTKGGYNYKAVADLLAPYLPQAASVIPQQNDESAAVTATPKKSKTAQDTCPENGCAGVLSAINAGDGVTLKTCSICRYSVREKDAKSKSFT